MSEFKELTDREILILIAERQEQHARNIMFLNRVTAILGVAGIFEAGAHLKNMSFIVSILELFK